MENQFSNSEFELITQLIDGELSAEQAAEVNKLIADNPALQSEFEQQSEITKAIGKDKEAFTPPPAAKENIFAALGIPQATNVPTAAVVSAEAGNWVSMVAAFAATLMTFTMFYSLNNFDKNSVATNNIPLVSSVERANNNNILIGKQSEIKNETTENQVVENLAQNSIEITNTNSSQIIRNNSSLESISALESNNLTETNSIAQREQVQSWNANIITSKKSQFYSNTNFILSANDMIESDLVYTRDYLTVIRTKAGSGNNNSGKLDVSFLTNYITKDVRGIMSAGLTWYDASNTSDLKNPVFIGGGLEYTPSFTELLSNKYFDTFVNGQLFIGRTPSYKMEAGLTTNLGGLTNFPIVIGYSKTYVRDFQFINQETNDGMFIGTEISF